MTHDIGLLGRAILRREANRARHRAAKLRTLHNIGTVIVSSEDVDMVLTRVVEAAVFITNAEEGSLLLLDEDTDELYLRAQKGLGERYANGYRLPVEDSIAGEVLRTGLSQRLAGVKDGLKVVTGYMVNSIVYVPISGANGAIGVLSVDNQMASETFSEDDEEFLMILAGYAGLALENARRIKDLQWQSEELVQQRARELAKRTQGAGVDSATVVVYQPPAHAPFEVSPSDHLIDLVKPYVTAMADIQHCIDELEGRPPSKVRLLATTYDAPAIVTIEGAHEAARLIRDIVSPRRQQLQDLMDRLLLAQMEAKAERARLEALEARARVAVDAGGNGWAKTDVAGGIAHLQGLQAECESVERALQRNKIELVCDLISKSARPLSCVDTIQYVIRILPALDHVLVSPLRIMTSQQDAAEPAQETAATLLG